MSSTVDQVLTAALALPAPERAALAEKLLDSLEPANQAEIDAAWAAEAEDRLRAYKEGTIKAVPAEEVFSSLAGKPKP
jgi:putative addiction module component (TIGR02574 family)